MGKPSLFRKLWRSQVTAVPMVSVIPQPHPLPLALWKADRLPFPFNRLHHSGDGKQRGSLRARCSPGLCRLSSSSKTTRRKHKPWRRRTKWDTKHLTGCHLSVFLMGRTTCHH